MNFSISINNQGITLTSVGSPAEPLKADPEAPQIAPRGCYVYAHLTPSGEIFYIGKGSRDRAWNEDRHYLWSWYVSQHLQGQYTVRILKDTLSSEAAEELESEWIAQHAETLVNWFNMGRKTDFKAIERFHALRNQARELLLRAKQLEATDAESAVAACRAALTLVHEYANIKTEGGFLGQLIDEHARHVGAKGELAAIDRLSIILVRAKRKEEARAEVQAYFEMYPGDLNLAAASAVLKRVGLETR